KSLCVLGCGTMGEAIVAGLPPAGRLPRARVIVTARRQAGAARLEARPEGEAPTANRRGCEAAEVVLVCLKPQRYAEVLDNPAMRAALSGKLLYIDPCAEEKQALVHVRATVEQLLQQWAEAGALRAESLGAITIKALAQL